MSSSRLHDWSKNLGRRWDRWRIRLGLGERYPITIVPYRGFGREDYIYFSGRVLRDKSIIRRDGDSPWRNFINNVKRFNSREINQAQLEITFGDRTFRLESDAEGYFYLEEDLAPPLSPVADELWQPVTVRVYKVPPRQPVDVRRESIIMIPRAADFGLISDIDDTILKTEVTSLLKLRTLYLTLLKNAGSRIAFRQVSAFYRALKAGPGGTAQNPFFYVSNSPWNLYDLLEEFLELNNLPRGPILLRDFGLPYQDLPADYRGHKYEQIARILRTYPELPFILVGDSAEKDTDIYLSITESFPGRIRAIYIRDVLHPGRARRIKKIIQSRQDVPVSLIRTYEEAARHAAALGLIRMERFTAIQKGNA
jgi:phosphatidate phosphatase APP1